MPKRAPRFDERSFHAWLAARLPAGRTGALPLGDDAAALRPPAGSVAVVSTDALVEGSHFLPDSPPDAIGSAAAGVNLSDLAAKGATPAGLLLAMLLPSATPPRWAEQVVLGAERAMAAVGSHVVGGDTKAAPRRVVVGMTVGWARPDRLAPRSGARPGDLIVTTGTVGRGGWAASALSRTARAPALRALLHVEPRIAAGRALAPRAHAMVDTSDGIAEAAHLLSAASGVRVRLEEDALPYYRPLHALALRRRRALAFFGGDYELLAAIPPERLSEARAAVRSAGVPLTVVGSVERGAGARLATGRGVVPLPRSGWDPFRPRRPGSA